MEEPHQRIIGLYEDTAAAFDAIRSRDLFERPWLERFAALLPERGTILDLGCGTGEPIARHLVESGYRLTGVDSSSSMIALCRQRLPGHQWIVADMRALALHARFDGILAWHSFFHLHPDDQRAMFPRFAAHAAPGAALMFTSGPAHGEKIGEWQGEPLYHASLDPGEYRDLLAANGFELLSYQIDVAEGPFVWLARSRLT